MLHWDNAVSMKLNLKTADGKGLLDLIKNFEKASNYFSSKKVQNNMANEMERSYRNNFIIRAGQSSMSDEGTGNYVDPANLKVEINATGEDINVSITNVAQNEDGIYYAYYVEYPHWNKDYSKLVSGFHIMNNALDDTIKGMYEILDNTIRLPIRKILNGETILQHPTALLTYQTASGKTAHRKEPLSIYTKKLRNYSLYNTNRMYKDKIHMMSKSLRERFEMALAARNARRKNKK